MIRNIFTYLYSYSLKNQETSNSPSSSSSLARKTPSHFPIIPSKTPTSEMKLPIFPSNTHFSCKNDHSWFPSRSFLQKDANRIFFELGKQSSLRVVGKQSWVMKSIERGLRGIEREGQRKEPLIVNKSLSIKTPIQLSSSYPSYPISSSCPSSPTPFSPNMTVEKLNFILCSMYIPFALKYNFTLGNYSLEEFYWLIVDTYTRGLFSSDVLPVHEVERFYDCLENVDVTTSIADSSNEVENRKHGIRLLVGSILLISLVCISAGMKMGR